MIVSHTPSCIRHISNSPGDFGRPPGHLMVGLVRLTVSDGNYKGPMTQARSIGLPPLPSSASDFETPVRPRSFLRGKP